VAPEQAVFGVGCGRRKEEPTFCVKNFAGGVGRCFMGFPGLLELYCVVAQVFELQVCGPTWQVACIQVCGSRAGQNSECVSAESS
jgi:hypothetical protein